MRISIKILSSEGSSSWSTLYVRLKTYFKVSQQISFFTYFDLNPSFDISGISILKKIITVFIKLRQPEHFQYSHSDYMFYCHA